jgi:hypothetical protein
VRKIVALTITAMPLLAGCFGYEPFQPNPDPDQRWRKTGATNTGIVAALLECGVPDPRGPDHRIRVDRTPDEVALSKLCMENAGFVSDREDSWSGYCKYFKAIDSCRKGTQAPHRDINKRLNSQFCQVFPRADVCR